MSVDLLKRVTKGHHTPDGGIRDCWTKGSLLIMTMLDEKKREGK